MAEIPALLKIISYETRKNLKLSDPNSNPNYVYKSQQYQTFSDCLTIN